MPAPLKIGTRESELAKWQANLVKNLLQDAGIESELVYISSEGDVDLVTPLYEMGVQGIFTKTLDVALLNKRIDIAVHSFKEALHCTWAIKQNTVIIVVNFFLKCNSLIHYKFSKLYIMFPH